MKARSRFQVGRALAVPFATMMVSLALPPALAGAGLGWVPGAESLALAQGDPVTEVARQRYNEGIKAFDAGKFEDARAAFLQAYALKRHPAVLLNVGQAELRSGHHEDAGNHLQQFLRDHAGATPDQKNAAQKGIAEAKKKAGFVIVIADATGADIAVDGVSVGKSPLLDPVFVKPGKHTFNATFQGHTATSMVDAKPGIAATAVLTLGVGGAPAPPPVAPLPPPPPVAPPLQPAPVPMPPPSYGPPPGPPMMEPPPMGPGPDHVSSGREPFFHWYKRKPVMWVGTGLMGIGLIGGIVFPAAAASASASSNNNVMQIKRENAANPGFNPTGTNAICGNPNASPPTPALAHYVSACALVEQDISNYNTNVALAAASWVVFGVGAAGSIIYAIVDWLPGKSRASNDGPKILGIAPIISPTDRGLGVTGVF